MYDANAILAAARATARYLFRNEEEPTPVGLDEVAAPLRDTHGAVVSFLLNLRLVVRWQGNGVGVTFLRVNPHPAEGGALAVDLRVYDEDEMLPYLRAGVIEAGATDVTYLKGHGQGGDLRFVVPAGLVRRISGR